MKSGRHSGNGGSAVKCTALILFAILFFAGGSLLADDIDDAWAYIVSAYETVDYETVISESTALLDQVSPFPDLYLIRAISERESGYYQDALDDFDSAEYLQPDNGYIYFHRGYTYLDIGYFNEAVVDFTQTIQLLPDMYEAWWNRGIAYNWIGENRDALKDLNKAIDLIPGKTAENPYLYRDRGVVLNELGMYNKAVEDYSKAIDLYPDEHIFYAERGLVLQALGNHAAAVVDLDTAILLNPIDNADHYFNRGVSLAQLLDFESAMNDFLISLEIAPNAVDALVNLAWCNIQLGQLEEAVRRCETAIQLMPDYPVAYFNRGSALERMHEYEAARDDYRQAVSLAEDDWTGEYDDLLYDAIDAIEKLDELIASRSE